MSSDSSYSERRGGERVLIRIPIKLYALGKEGQHVNEPSETVVVSRFGAMVRASVPLKQTSTIEVMNNFSQEVEKFRVVWVADKPKDGKFDVGIELVRPREDFWGVSFPARARKA